jgi:hypothetical protein
VGVVITPTVAIAVACAVSVARAPAPGVVSAGVSSSEANGFRLVIPCTILGVTLQNRMAKTKIDRSATMLRPEQPMRLGGL